MDDAYQEGWESSGSGRLAGNANLVDLVDRLLGGGVVLAGDITLAVADVDLVHISLRALVSSVESLRSRPPPIEVVRVGEDGGR